MSYIYPHLHCVGYLLLKRLRIHNANAISSPLTYGFPAITGFTGAIHALSRKISQIEGLADIRLDGTLIACHDCQVQAYREYAAQDFSFVQTRNPILRSGKTTPITEEGRCHLQVSLVVGVYAEDYLPDEQITLLKNQVARLVQQQRFASGSVVAMDKFEAVSFCQKEDIGEFASKLMPAFVLMSDHDSLMNITEQLQQDNPEATALDALIQTATLHHIPQDEQGLHWQTTSVKQGRGQIVPIPVGFCGISSVFEAGQMKNARHNDYQSQYVEAIYSLGKWVFVSGIDDLATALWYPKQDDAHSLYLVSQEQDF